MKVQVFFFFKNVCCRFPLIELPLLPTMPDAVIEEVTLSSNILCLASAVVK